MLTPRVSVQLLDLKLAAPKGTPGAKLVFAVVRRDLLRKMRDTRWDLVSSPLWRVDAGTALVDALHSGSALLPTSQKRRASLSR